MNIKLFENNMDVILKVNYKNRAISTTLNGGIMSNISHIIHHHVSDDFDFKKEHDKLVKYLNSKSVIPFMTAVNAAKKHVMYSCMCSNVNVTVSLTAGFLNPYLIVNGEIRSLLNKRLSTVNIAVFVDRFLNKGAMVDAIGIISEAKALSLYDLTGGAMHGTTTDAIALISDATGSPQDFAGPATPVGRAIALAVHNALLNGIKLKPLSH
ncbi:MAG: adenosylcobinamide amidohydrolase [Nitrososphaeria archaeon]